jgi:hypothetical protein
MTGLSCCRVAAIDAINRQDKAYPFSDRKRPNALGKCRLGVVLFYVIAFENTRENPDCR